MEGFSGHTYEQFLLRRARLTRAEKPEPLRERLSGDLLLEEVTLRALGWRFCRLRLDSARAVFPPLEAVRSSRHLVPQHGCELLDPSQHVGSVSSICGARGVS